MRRIVGFFVVLSSAMIGCGGAGSLPEDDSPVYRTVVHLNGEDEPTVMVQEITRAEQRRQVEARLANLHRKDKSPEGIASTKQAISEDYDCNSSSMWMFDEENLQGNEICFYGPGTASLWNYHRGRYFCPIEPFSPDCEWLNSWATATRSYWSGIESGSFFGRAGPTSDIFGTENFAPIQRVNSAGVWARMSYTLTLTD